MPSGFHVHFCPRCKTHWQCPQVTHCQKEYDALCTEHLNVAIAEHNQHQLDGLKTFNQSFNQFFGVKR